MSTQVMDSVLTGTTGTKEKPVSNIVGHRSVVTFLCLDTFLSWSSLDYHLWFCGLDTHVSVLLCVHLFVSGLNIQVPCMSHIWFPVLGSSQSHLCCAGVSVVGYNSSTQLPDFPRVLSSEAHLPVLNIIVKIQLINVFCSVLLHLRKYPNVIGPLQRCVTLTWPYLKRIRGGNMHTQEETEWSC